MPSYIADGYTFAAGIKPLEHMHDGLEFKYRPVTPLEAARYTDEGSEGTGEEIRKVQAKWIMDKVQSWNLVKPDGSRAQISTSTLLDNLHPALFQRIFEVVMGWEKPDYGQAPDLEAAEKN